MTPSSGRRRRTDAPQSWVMDSLRSRFAWRPAVTRVAADPHVLLAMAVVFAALVIELLARVDAVGLVVPCAIYLVVQIVLALRMPAGRSPGPTQPGC